MNTKSSTNQLESPTFPNEISFPNSSTAFGNPTKNEEGIDKKVGDSAFDPFSSPFSPFSSSSCPPSSSNPFSSPQFSVKPSNSINTLLSTEKVAQVSSFSDSSPLSNSSQNSNSSLNNSGIIDAPPRFCKQESDLNTIDLKELEIINRSTNFDEIEERRKNTGKRKARKCPSIDPSQKNVESQTKTPPFQAADQPSPTSLNWDWNAMADEAIRRANERRAAELQALKSDSSLTNLSLHQMNSRLQESIRQDQKKRQVDPEKEKLRLAFYNSLSEEDQKNLEKTFEIMKQHGQAVYKKQKEELRQFTDAARALPNSPTGRQTKRHVKRIDTALKNTIPKKATLTCDELRKEITRINQIADYFKVSPAELTQEQKELYQSGCWAETTKKSRTYSTPNKKKGEKKNLKKLASPSSSIQTNKNHAQEFSTSSAAQSSSSSTLYVSQEKSPTALVGKSHLNDFNVTQSSSSFETSSAIPIGSSSAEPIISAVSINPSPLKKKKTVKNIFTDILNESVAEHKRVTKRWHTKNPEDIRLLEDFEKNLKTGAYEKIHRYSKLSDEEILKRRECHYLPGLTSLLIKEERELYTFPTNRGVAMLAKLITPTRSEEGVVYFGVEKRKLGNTEELINRIENWVYHAHFKKVKNSDQIFIDCNERPSLEEPEENTVKLNEINIDSLGTSTIIAYKNGILEVRFVNEEHYLEIQLL